MTADFVGSSMVVTLNEPPGCQLRGTVEQIIPGNSLTLSNVTILQNGMAVGSRAYETIPVGNCADIVSTEFAAAQAQAHAQAQAQAPPPQGYAQMGPQQHAPMPMPVHAHPMQAPVAAPAQPPPQAPIFEDPAILSMSRKGTRSNNNSNMNSRQNSNQGNAPDQRGGSLAEVSNNQARKRSIVPGVIPVPRIPEATMLPNPIIPRRLTAAKKTDYMRDDHKITPAAILVDPMETLGLNDDTEATDAATLDSTNSPDKRRNRPSRNQRARQGRNISKGTDALQTNPAEGWRKTPLLRPNSSFQPFNLLPKSLAAARRADENGWETNDATDVQEMPEFDFQASLKMFDKRGDFKRFREQDMTADEDTVFGMNKTPSKNFAPTENVLEARRDSFKDRRESMTRALNAAVKAGAVETPPWNSEDSDSDDEKEVVGSGRVSRARAHAGSGSGARSRRGESILRTSIGPGGKRPESSGLGKSVHTSKTRQPRKRTTLPAGTPRSRSQAKAAAGLSGTISPTKGAFYLVPADRRVDVASALEMLNMENVAAELGMSEDLITEHAARGIAEVALKALNHGKGHKRVARSPELSVKPHVVIYAGNNKSGIRAIATGRLLRHHGIDVIVCVVGLDREPELLDGLRRQLKLFRVMGGKGMLPGTVTNKDGLFSHIQHENVGVELILDGLLGLTMSFKELVHRPGELTDVTELIKYGNRSSALVLAIDVPSGLNPITGEPMVVREEEEGGWLDPDLVVCLGVPKTGLLEAMRMGMGSAKGGGDGEGKGWKLSLVDVGIGRVVWKRAKMKTRRGTEFEGNWVLGMRFQKGSE